MVAESQDGCNDSVNFYDCGLFDGGGPPMHFEATVAPVIPDHAQVGGPGDRGGDIDRQLAAWYGECAEDATAAAPEEDTPDQGGAEVAPNPPVNEVHLFDGVDDFADDLQYAAVRAQWGANLEFERARTSARQKGYKPWTWAQYQQWVCLKSDGLMEGSPDNVAHFLQVLTDSFRDAGTPARAVSLNDRWAAYQADLAPLRGKRLIGLESGLAGLDEMTLGLRNLTVLP